MTFSLTITKNKEGKNNKTPGSRYTYQNKLNKACFNKTWPMEFLRTFLR